MIPASAYLCNPYLQHLARNPVKMRCKLDIICHNGHESTRYISEVFPNLVSLRLSAVHTTAEDMEHLKHCIALQALRMDACHGILYEEVKPLLLQLLQKQKAMKIVAVGCADLLNANQQDLMLPDCHPPHSIQFVVDESLLFCNDCEQIKTDM